MQQTQSKSAQSKAHKGSTPQSRLLEVTHDFNVPVVQLFEGFKTSAAIKTWWWPQSLSVGPIEYNFRQGGNYFISMTGAIEPQGNGGMTGTFEEIVDNKRIVMSDHFADDKGRAISAKDAKMPGVWPEVVYITFDFESTDANSSRVTLSQEGIPNELQKDCIQGWNEMFDKLEEYLSGRKQ